MPSPPGTPGTQTRGGSSLKPLLLGCAALLGLGLLAGLGLTVYGIFWLVTPGRQSPTNVVVGPESVGAMRLNRAASDPGLQALFRKLVLELQRAGREGRGRKLPAWLEGLQSWQATQQSQNLALWLPSEGTLSFERTGEDEHGLPVAALNFRRFIRPMALLFEHLAKSDRQARVQRHAGHDVIISRRGGGLCFAHSTLLLADRAEALFPVLDRLAQPPSTSPLLQDLEGLSERWDLAGSLRRPQETGALLRLLLRAARPAQADDAALDDPDPDQAEAPADDEARTAVLLAAESARFGLDVRSADEIDGQLRARYADAAAAQAALLALEPPLLALQRKAVAADLRLNLSHEAIDAELLVEARLSGLEAAISRWISDVTAEAQDGGRE